jgi:trehalose 6-phosphate phosphatase
MRHNLFESLDEVSARLQAAEHLLICLDLDDTLDPGATDPAPGYSAQSVKSVLASLVALPCVSVAVISGRDRSDLFARLEVPGLVYAGNHGLEISSPGRLFVEPTASSNADTLHELSQDLARKLMDLASVRLEEKGLTLSIYFQDASPEEAEQTRRLVHGALAANNHPFHLSTGEKTFEIQPRVHWNKAAAVEWVLEEIARRDTLVIYLGDNPSSEEAFKALEHGVTIGVGEGKESAAQYYVANGREVIRFLEWLDGEFKDGRCNRPPDLAVRTN